MLDSPASILHRAYSFPRLKLYVVLGVGRFQYFINFRAEILSQILEHNRQLAVDRTSCSTGFQRLGHDLTVKLVN